MVGFFPTPYPDECLYSVLCRYYVRSGSAGYDSVSKELFGSRQSLALSVYLPIRLDCAENWLPKSSGVTRRDIVINHTLYPYWALTFPNFRSELEELIHSEEPKANIYHPCSLKVRRSRVKYLRYCPLCVAEDIAVYGETYWHRQHQLSEMFYCVKHEIRLADSSVLFQNTLNGFYPAIVEGNTRCDVNAFDNLAPYKDKLLKIGWECEWIITHSLDVDWSVNGYEKYWRLLRDKGLASIKGYCNDHKALNKSFFEYWGKDFLDVLFDNICIPRFESWYHKFGKIQVNNFTPLYHILVMCWVADSVSEFVNSNPAETPFGHPPFVCENRICSHYQIDGAEMVDMVDYGQGFTAYFECSCCGMRYKHKKSTDSREQRFIVDYGHLWLGELCRCCQDPEITNDKAMKILKCGSQTLANQKKKHGLMNPVSDYMGMEPEAYYKTKVLEICQEYDEVTIALLDEKAPRAYGYLQDHDYEWIRSRVVFDNERRFRLEREKLLLTKLCEIIAAFDADGYPDRVLSYGYIANLIGATRDELRYKMSPNSELRAFLNEIVEHKSTWRQERVARMRATNAGQKGIVKGHPITERQEPTERSGELCSKREGMLLNRLREVIVTFETEGYPDKQLSYDFLASLVGSTRSELRSKAEVNTELQAFLSEIVEHRGVWREERAAKTGDCCSKREKQIRNAIEQILSNPPKEQISRNYIAKVANLYPDVFDDNPYLVEITNDVVESKEEWFTRRLIAAYRGKPIEGRPYSTFAICRAASIDSSTYKRHRELFREIVNNLNLKPE
jgi:hypothetical protein